MEANKRGFKGVWLCAAIYEAQELSAVEKLLLAEIDALTTELDACCPVMRPTLTFLIGSVSR